MQPRKILIIGEPDRSRYLGSKLSGKSERTAFSGGLDFYEFNYSGESIQLWDQTTDRAFVSMLPMFAQGATDCILALDLSQPIDPQRDSLLKWKREFRSGVNFFLVATNADIGFRTESEIQNLLRETAERLGCISFQVCSETSNDSVFQNINARVIAPRISAAAEKKAEAVLRSEEFNTVPLLEEKKIDSAPSKTISNEEFKRIVLAYETKSWTYALFKCFGLSKYRSGVIRELNECANKMTDDKGTMQYSAVEQIIAKADDKHKHRLHLFTKSDEKQNSTATDDVVVKLKNAFK